MKHTPPLLLLALIGIACNTPADRSERLQHEFWEKFAHQDYFEVRCGQERLYWPLPPDAGRGLQQREAAERLLKEAQAIARETQNEQDLQRLRRIQLLLSNFLEEGGEAVFDPSKCVPVQPLREWLSQPEGLSLLEQLPGYYAEVEKRWQRPAAHLVPKAVQASLGALDAIELAEKQHPMAGGPAWQSAKAAIKDYIGLCQSVYLGE